MLQWLVSIALSGPWSVLLRLPLSDFPAKNVHITRLAHTIFFGKIMSRTSSSSLSRILRATEATIGLWSLSLQMLAPASLAAVRLGPGQTEIKESCFQLRNTYLVQPGDNVSGERFVVCADINELFSGLGCCLSILAPCWKYARKTQRTLVIDWRGNPYTRSDPRKNLFPLLFQQPVPSEFGVACIADDSINDLRLPQPILGPDKPIVRESGTVEAFPGDGIDNGTLCKLMARCDDVDFATVLPSLASTFFVASKLGPKRWPIPSAMTFREAQRLYRSLKLQPKWAAIVSQFYGAHMAEQPVIGVHIRHGNGEERYRDHFQPRVIPALSSFIESLAEKIRRYAANCFGRRYSVFLCTDSDEVVSSMKPYFSSLVTRNIWRPPPGHGVDFDHAYKQSNGGVQAAANALIDMQLLAKCDLVLMTRPTAFAAHVPYIMEKPGAVFFDHKQTATL